jgi:hypothetical protein
MIRRLLFSACALALLAACQPTVLTQPVAVATTPAGATVKADDGQTCQTPCQVTLTRNADHALTISKDGFRQQSILVHRQYQSDRVMARAVNDGVQSGQFFKNPYMGINSGVQSLDEQEKTGEAYVLVPSAVNVALIPEGGGASAAMPGLEAMDATDHGWFGRTLETLATGQSQSWTNAGTGLRYTLFPGPARQENGAWVRSFTLRIANAGGAVREVTGQAARAGAGQWNPEAAAPAGGAASPGGAGDVTSVQPPGMDPGAAAAGAAVGAASAVSVPVVTGKDSSSHTSTSTSPDGSSTTTKTTKSSVKGSVSVNPGAVLQDILEMEGAGTGQ